MVWNFAYALQDAEGRLLDAEVERLTPRNLIVAAFNVDGLRGLLWDGIESVVTSVNLLNTSDFFLGNGGVPATSKW